MAATFSSGEMRHKVTLQSRSTSIDSFGGQVLNWNTVATVWAAMEPSGGRELLAAQAMAIDQPMSITLRWKPAFADPKAVASMRVVYGTRVFNIHASNNVEERGRLLVLLTSEGLNDG